MLANHGGARPDGPERGSRLEAHCCSHLNAGCPGARAQGRTSVSQPPRLRTRGHGYHRGWQGKDPAGRGLRARLRYSLARVAALSARIIGSCLQCPKPFVNVTKRRDQEGTSKNVTLKPSELVDVCVHARV